MKFITKINKPYTDIQRADFIVENNHLKGYEIKETETALEAWGMDEKDLLEQAKREKKDEALSKAYDFEENGTVEHKNCIFEMSLKNRDNLRDTVEALTAIGQSETTWNDKNDNLVVLTLEDIQYIRLNLILGRIQRLWITQYPEYLTAIEQATTVEEVENIEVNYES